MILKTERLTLRPQQQDDAPALFLILNDTEAMCFWSRPPITRLAVVEELVREQQTVMAKGLCQYWTVIEGSDAIGSVDLSLIRDGSAELGFLLRRDRWGFGFAVEAVAAIVTHALGPLGLTRLAAAIQIENRAAARVLEKTGFAQVDRRNVAIASGAMKDCAFYLRKR
ncbi:MAG TPA: GNAT family N-acetyltransferase [Rhizomicrobium sp.]